MQSLPDLSAEIPDPRRAQGRWHRLRTVLAIAAGAVLCDMRGYHAIADWAQSLGPKARKHFGCRWEKDRYGAPSEYVIRQVLLRILSADLDRALRRWNKLYAEEDQTPAIDGKTLCNALDEHGHPIHIMSVVGHENRHR